MLRSVLFRHTVVALLAAVVAPVQAQGTAELSSAPIDSVRYTVTFDSTAGVSRTLQLEMSFTTRGIDPVVLSLPRWTPGAYDLSEFARFVRGFEAYSAAGDTLRWNRADPHSWRVHPDGPGRIRVRYGVIADSLDTSMAWSRTDVAMFNGTAVFMYPAGRPFDFSATVLVSTSPHWLIATGMRSAGSPREYIASDYHELVDMPFLVGRFDLDSARILDRWFRLATYPVGSVAGNARALTWEQLRRMLPPMVRMWGDIPFEDYTIMQVADASFGGASGLEHANSHVNVVSPQAIGHPFLTALYAHEIVHAWNVKRLRPAELSPYRYDQPQFTASLWISEGITDYQADLALVRGGIITRSGFLQTVSDKMEEVAHAPAISLEDASVATWVLPLDGTAYVYYPKGSLAGLLLDIMIRDATANRASLDHALRDLYRATTGTGRGYTPEEFWAMLERTAGGRSFADFRRRHVTGREPLPLGRVLPLAGLRLAVDTIREPVVGVRTLLEADGVLVTAVESGGAAAEAGVQPGDFLLSIGGLRVTDRDFADRFRVGWSAREGTPLLIRVRRDGGEQELRGTVRLSTRYAFRVEEDRSASAGAVRIRDGILRGLVAP